MVKTINRCGMLLGLALLCLWQLESGWPPARTILRWVHPTVQVASLMILFVGCVWGVVVCLIATPFKQEWRRMRASTSRPPVSHGKNPLWDRNIDG